MTNKKGFQMQVSERQRRIFSDNFKREKVKELERRVSSIAQLSKQYEVSRTCIYKWIAKFGSMKHKKERIIVESQSDTQQLLALQKKVAELERLLGQKQILLDFKDKMIDLAEEYYGVDIKKKCSTPPSDISTSSDQNGTSV
jgi:transposase